MKEGEVKTGLKVVPFQKTAGKVRNIEVCSAWKQAKENSQPFLYVVGFNIKNLPVLGYTPGGVGHTFNFDDFKAYKEPEEKEPLLRVYDLMVKYKELVKNDVSCEINTTGEVQFLYQEGGIAFYDSISDAVFGISLIVNKLKKPYEYLEEVKHKPSGKVFHFLQDVKDGTYLLSSEDSGIMLCPKDSICKITKTDTKENE